MPITARRAFSALLVLTVASCSETPADTAPGLAGAIQANVEYSTLARLATETGLLTTLESGGPYTVLAPTNIAFKYVGVDAEPVLTAREQRPILTRVLRHHVIPGRMAPEDFVDGDVLMSLEGVPLRVRRVRNEVVIEGSTIDLEDASEADNGIAYPASDVIRTNLTVRERIELAPSFSMFRAFADQTGILDRLDGLGGKTVIVPVNDAFERIQETTNLLSVAGNADVLQKVIRAHVLPEAIDLEALPSGTDVEALERQTLRVTQRGGALYVDGLRVLSRAYEAADGRFYLFGDLLFKGITLAERLRVLPRVSFFPGEMRQEADIWQRLNDADDALTVFAPFDAIYVRRNAEVVTALGQLTNASLLQRTRRVLVVEGRYALDDLTDGLTLQALDGSTLEVQRSGDLIFVGGRQVTPSGAEVSNGALYTLDAFIPPQVDLFDSLILHGFTDHVDAIRAARLESLYRTAGLSAFVLPNGKHRIQVPRVFTYPDLPEILRYQTTREDLPSLLTEGISFETLQGDTRRICRARNPPGDPLSPVQLDGVADYGGGVLSYNGLSQFFPVDSLLQPSPRFVPCPPA